MFETPDAAPSKKYYCPDLKCKHHGVHMTIDENWAHLVDKHGALKGAPKYKKLPHGW